MQASLEKENVGQTMTGLVAVLKQLGKISPQMKHSSYYLDAVELLRLAISLLLQVGKIDVGRDAAAVFKNDSKHAMLFQVCSFLASFASVSQKLKVYSEDHAGAGDEFQLMSICCDLPSTLLPLLEPESLTDAIRRQCSQYELGFQSSLPKLSKTAGGLFQGGENDWKATLTAQDDIAQVLKVADKTLGSVSGKTLKAELDKMSEVS